MSDQPIAHSTPKIVPIHKRPGIREAKASVIKGLNSDNNEFNSDNELSRSDDNTEDIEENIKNEIVENDKHDQNFQKIFKKFAIFFLLIALMVGFFKLNGYSIEENDIGSLARKYGYQEEDFWISFQALIRDSIKFNQPKCLILMYNESTAATLEPLIWDLSKYAACEITSCTSIPVFIEAHQFQRKSAPNDYGEIITMNKNDLTERGVMVVKNMETISGQSAMAFQSFCDEYQPVVPRALILFTLKIDQHPKDKSKYVEYILREKWSDLNDDLFFPLLTRISNFIFIVQERNE